MRTYNVSYELKDSAGVTTLHMTNVGARPTDNRYDVRDRFQSVLDNDQRYTGTVTKVTQSN